VREMVENGEEMTPTERLMDDIRLGQMAVMESTGKLPNVMLIGGEVLLALRPDLADTIDPKRAYWVRGTTIEEYHD
jgi:hypothetical protein